jgi:uncharacterized tellurite resistance protein B-like protein
MPIGFLKRLFESGTGTPLPPDDARAAIASVLVMAARADHEYTDVERGMIDRVLQQRYGVSAFEAGALRAEGEAAEAESIDIYQFTRAIRQAVPHEERQAIIEALWGVILTDDVRDPHEDSLMRQMTDRLGLSPMDSALARQKVQGGGSVQGM